MISLQPLAQPSTFCPQMAADLFAEQGDTTAQQSVLEMLEQFAEPTWDSE
ncbi:MAG TPA: hypothetical protein V6C78_26205 [Crinalium sp.]|jgi:hypothetical protein